MLDILLINPSGMLSPWESKLGSRLPSLGLASLASYIREQSISVNILDACSLMLSTEEILEYIHKNPSRYIGITSTTFMISSAAQLAEKIKAKFPSIITIIGGPHVSALPEDTIKRFSSFDIGVYGEGEKTLCEIVKKGKIDNNIKGIVFNDNGRIIKNGPREYISNLDELPFPAYDLLPGYPAFYCPTPNNYLRLPVVSVISSRGCPFSCSFCAQPIFGRNVRSCSVDYLISHIKYLCSKYHIREICFYDDVFLLHKDRVYEFIDKKAKNNLDVSWSCESRIDQVDAKMLKDMKKSGCWQINFGIESGSQRVLDYFNKRITVEQIRETLALVKEANIRARAYLIIGCPVETAETLMETKKMVLSVPLDEIHISFLTPLPGSKVYKDIMGERKDVDFQKINQYLVSYVPPHLTKEMLKNFMNRLYKDFYLNPRRLFRYFLMLFNGYKTMRLLGSFINFLKLTLGFSRK
ncbi:MAG: radical SAM protein [Elusimicrobiota bacterium]